MKIENVLEAKITNFLNPQFQTSLFAESQEIVNLPIVVAGVNNSSVLQSQMYAPASEINSIDIYSSSQIGTKEVANSNFGMEQVSPSHISAIQLSPLQHGFSQVSSTQVGISEIAFTQVSTGQVGITQVGSFQINPPQVSLSQIGTTEINSAQIGSDSLAVGFVIRINVKGAADSTQISSPNIKSAKIPLPSFVTSNQFFTVHKFFFSFTKHIQ